MKILGLSPLDKDATATLVEDGRVVFAAAEERYSRVKQHAGFPHQALAATLETTGTRPEDIDVVAYSFLDAEHEARLMRECIDAEVRHLRTHPLTDLAGELEAATKRLKPRTEPIHGLSHPDFTMRKGSLKEAAYRLLGLSGLAPHVARTATRRWAVEAKRTHQFFQQELYAELEKLGLMGKLRRFEHHLSHAAAAYLASGFERALVVTLDGYGSGLSGSISLGEGGNLERLHNLRFPHSLGSFYETVTTSLGFHPDRHAGKIVGLAAYGDPTVLSDVLLSRVRQVDGDLQIDGNLNVFLSRHLASHFPVVDVAAAYQHVLEVTATGIVKHWLDKTGCDTVVLSGGVTANVKMNQRLHEIDGVNHIFVDPDMGDGGCAAGLGMFLSLNGEVREPLHDVYLGPEYSDAELRAELEREGLDFETPGDMAAEVARRIHGGEVIARFAGRMEYGPRALGNRSILYHGRDPDVNAWLNARLDRTEFMPFAPVTLAEAGSRCYHGLEGAEHAAEFMTVTFDCTDEMKHDCPAAVHVDGTARPQLIRREVNPGYYDIVKAYEALSGSPSLINTSFNMHEEPIVCTPRDAVRAFLDGHLDGLAMGPYFVPAPRRDAAPRPDAARSSLPAQPA